MTQIVENWARVSGQVEQWTPPTEPGAMGTLTLRVETVKDIASGKGKPYKNLISGHKGRSLEVRVPASAALRLKLSVGDRVELDVRRGRSVDHVFARPEPFGQSD